MDRRSNVPPGRTTRSGGSELNLRDLKRALRRRWKLFFGLAGGAVAVVMLVTLLLPPVWESEASVRVRSSQATGGGGLMAGLEDAIPMGLDLPGLGDTEVETEIGVLGSRLLVEAVADSLALHVSLSRPWREFRTSVLHVLDAGLDAPRGTYTMRLQSDGTYDVSSRWTREEVELPERVTIGEPFAVGQMRFLLEPELAEAPPRVVQFKVAPFRRMVQRLRRDLDIRREDTRSRLVTVSYRHQDPHLAQEVVNRIVGSFLDYSETMNRSDSRREVEILSEQVAHYSAQLAEADDRLQAYQELQRIIAPEEQATQQVKRIAELQVHHDAIEVEREALAEFLTHVSTREAAPRSETPYRQLATFPTFLQNGAVQGLLEALTELENSRSELLVQRTAQNVDVRMIQERVHEIEEQIHTLATDYLEGLDTQLASTSSSLSRFSAELEAMPEVELEYARRVREQKLLTEVYLFLQGRLTEAQVQEAIDDARARPVDVGVIEDRPAFPRPEISLVLSIVLGLMVGLFGVVVAESTNRNIRSKRDAQEAAGGPVLGIIPTFRKRAGTKDANPVTRSDPWQPASEGYRALALTLLSRDATPRTIVVASPEPDDGRSTVAANLAVALVEQGLRVVLLDGDLRSGTLHSIFRVPAHPGWVRAAVSGGPLEEARHEAGGGDSAGTLHILPAGTASGHPLEILTSEKVRAFLGRLREAYDVVILDTPPLAIGHDAVVLTSLADGALLVARSEKTATEAVAEAAEQIRRTGGNLLGVVLNDVRSRFTPRSIPRR